MTKIKQIQILNYFNMLKMFGYNYSKEFIIEEKSSCDFSLPSNNIELREVVKSCHLCELSKHRKNVLFSSGRINSKIMFICDEPSKTEDELGEFYHGNSGEMLLNMIKNVLKLNKDDIYITTMLKCRPKFEASIQNYDSCFCYLSKQIELVKPKIIVGFGEKVFNYFIKDDGEFLQKRGDVLKYGNFTFIPTFSTQFLLKNPSYKKDSYEDLKKIKTVYEELI
ncbi:uracil-DNA glycosylase [Aliarcobacter thereius]|uniref:Uracil-DNA glycosylase n=2 Tax=Aliarcobacter thereius TaxID=544718 RepID=A0A5R9H5T4_9BACT|nr:uracil-DNA glycosylase [Aliarcobacter thereius]OCL90062.1 Uracil DNA glycosylase superfamily protein [Aliarcobacter thereius]OCL96338.1 Uracil DNA glycosylase superfamily protein [Aliarcobacter thereius LMG 24486]QBF15700.1 uracil-DNA glycosylase, family 4 [Aliarcobacter thereius LMG 24486]TLS71442.1 uracil-DNA glycosylase [Aliarcobacter thereius]TLS92515.1 uracil-DNA glycosylase [Aliarcobacter thereius]